MSVKSLWNLVWNPDMSDFSENFGLWVDFNDLHFTNSPNASPLHSTKLLGQKNKTP
jgi:hypothetical protein